MTGTIRNLTLSDVPSAMELSTAANWNHTADDWMRLFRLAPNGLRCVEENGRVVATTSVVTYGEQIGWIGMVLTHPESRRQGFARKLMQDAIASSEKAGVCTLKLDATDAGRPLYESLGFMVESCVERWERPAITGEASADLPAAQWNTHVLELDQKASGMSRGPLLQDLSADGNCTITSTAYVCSRTGRLARYLGPCVAQSASEARRLIEAKLDAESRWYWDLSLANVNAVACARDFGFKPTRTLWRMRRGSTIQNDDALVYAIAGFELG